MVWNYKFLNIHMCTTWYSLYAVEIENYLTTNQVGFLLVFFEWCSSSYQYYLLDVLLKFTIIVLKLLTACISSFAIVLYHTANIWYDVHCNLGNFCNPINSGKS